MGKEKKIRKKLLPLLLCLLLGGCGNPFLLPETRSDSVTETVESFEDRGEGQEVRENIINQETVSVSHGNYAYDTLDEEEKKVYDQMLSAILGYQEKVDLETKDSEKMRLAYLALSSDYGGLFWVNGYTFTSYTMGEELVNLEFSPSYTMSKEQKEETQQQIDQVVDRWLAGISLGDTDYAKAKYVFETLIEQVDYQEGTENNQNIISVFLNQKTVCQGYACATQYLFRQLGIPCTIISGQANGQAHSWNLVFLDGAYYYMDTTWGNSTYLDTDRQEGKFVNYNYLCMTEEEIFHTHMPGVSFPLPECASKEDNYYLKEGLYFESWQQEEIGAVFQAAWERGDSSASVKCADEEVFDQVLDYFITSQNIVEYCKGMEYVYYMEDRDLFVFTVNFN